jgi:hypothetical protein
MSYLPIAAFEATEVEQLQQVAHFFRFHWQTLHAAKGWVQVPKPGYALTTTLRTPGKISNLVPAGIMIDTSQLEAPVSSSSKAPKTGSFLLHIHPVHNSFFLRIIRRDTDEDDTFTTVLATVDSGCIAYWHGDPLKDSETILNGEVHDRVAQIWETHKLRPFDPFEL